MVYDEPEDSLPWSTLQSFPRVLIASLKPVNRLEFFGFSLTGRDENGGRFRGRSGSPTWKKTKGRHQG